MARGELKTCKVCSKEFPSYVSHQVCCSRVCNNKSNTAKKVIARYQKRVSSLPKRRYDKLKSECRRKRWEFDLSLAQYTKLLQQGCHYCGKYLLSETGKGLDRINNNRKYASNNVLPCCGICNKIKGDWLTVEEMKVVAKALASFREGVVS